MKSCRTLALALTFFCLALPLFAQQGSTTETIVLIRHGEKPSGDLGQLTVRGLNRALALPTVLTGKYGKPDFIFAPNPSVQNHSYSYVRPLATIEPTAIELGMPVNTQFGFDDIVKLQAELAKPIYANAVVIIAWEHLAEDHLAKNIMTAYTQDDSAVPDWPGSDYDSIFVIRVVRSGATTTATFTLDHEGLNDRLSDSYPGAAPAAAP